MTTQDAHALTDQPTPASLQDFDTLLAEIGSGVPDADQYRRMSELVLDIPGAQALAKMDPFGPAYPQAAMDLYLQLRGRQPEGYDPHRDEAPSYTLPDNIWTGLPPFSFRDAAMAAEHVLAWGAILRHTHLPKGARLLEYGPGSGQILLMAARLGFGAYGVDINETALRSIHAQADIMGLDIHTERGVFGEGFAGETFDTILFYEAFHHAFDFEALLHTLKSRLRPDGRLVLCGEPIVAAPCGPVPYPWGPRLDALSVFCIRRFGWMELGFTHDYFMKLARHTGWHATFHPFAGVGRAHVYVLEPGSRPPPPAPRLSPPDPLLTRLAALDTQLATLKADLQALQTSTSWRLTAPLRAARNLLRRR